MNRDDMLAVFDAIESLRALISRQRDMQLTHSQLTHPALVRLVDSMFGDMLRHLAEIADLAERVVVPDAPGGSDAGA
jgi:hypothetical protein